MVERLAALEERVLDLERQLRSDESSPGSQVAQSQLPPPPYHPPLRPPTVGPQGERAPAKPPIRITSEVLLRWAGLGLLILAAAFVVSTAIRRGWIGPELQLAGAVALGVILVGAGLHPRATHRGWAQSLVIAGMLILFTSSGAAFEWLELGNINISMVATIAAGLASVGLSRRLDSVFIALTALLGLVVVPLWLSAPDYYDMPAVVAFALGLAVVFHALHVERSWPGLYVVVAATTMVVQLLASAEWESEGHESTAAIQVMIAMSAVAHWIGPAIQHSIRPVDSATIRLASRVILAVPSWLLLVTTLLHALDERDAALLAGGLAIAFALAAAVLGLRMPTWLWAAQILSAAIVGSIALALWLDGASLVGALAAQAVALLVLSRHLDDTWFTVQSVATAAIVLVAAVTLTLEAIESDISWGGDLIHLGVFAATGAVGFALRDASWGKIIALATYGAMLLWVVSVFVHLSQGQVIVSGIWAAIGVAVVVVALGRRHLDTARVGLATLAVVVGKLLTIDLSEVDTFWRAGLFFVIGLGFLWLSSSIPRLMGADSATKDA